MGNKIKSILIFRTEHIGDYALSLPFIKTLRETYPNAKIDLVVGSWNKEFAEATPYVDNVIVWDNPLARRNLKILDFLNPKSILSIFSFFKKIRKNRYDFAIAFSNRKFIKILIRFFKAQKKIYGPGYLSNESEHERIDRMSEEINLQKTTGHIKLKTTRAQLEKVDDILSLSNGKRIVVHSTSPLEEKNWPTKNWTMLINILKKKHRGICFFFIGTTKDIPHINTMISKSGKKRDIINLAGKLNIAQTLHLISKSDLMIGVDSGPMHLAELTDTPIIALFGPTNERIWGPYRNIDTVIKKEKINGISIEEVLKSINDKIKE